MLFSQPRPAVRTTIAAAADLGAAIGKTLAPHFVALETDLEAFGTAPVL
jgi:hypothetical protein